jgi:hypothetical protein
MALASNNVVAARRAMRTTLFTTSNANARTTTSVLVGKEEYRNQHHGVDPYAIVTAEPSVRNSPFQLQLNDEDDNNWSFGLFAATQQGPHCSRRVT